MNFERSSLIKHLQNLRLGMFFCLTIEKLRKTNEIKETGKLKTKNESKYFLQLKLTSIWFFLNFVNLEKKKR